MDALPFATLFPVDLTDKVPMLEANIAVQKR